MQDEARKLLTDIREALDELDGFTAGIDLLAYEADSMRRAAVERKFEIIGEAFNILNHQNITSVNTTAYCISSSVPTGTPTTGVACQQVQSAPAKVSGVTDYLVANPLFGTNLNSNSNLSLIHI